MIVQVTSILDASALLAYLQDEPGANVALALHLRLPVLTTDRIWSNLNIGIDINVIR